MEFDDIPAHDQGPEAPAVLASAATGIVPFIERLGGDIDGIFGNAGIAPDMAGCPTLRLRLASFCALFEEAARRTGNFEHVAFNATGLYAFIDRLHAAAIEWGARVRHLSP